MSITPFPVPAVGAVLGIVQEFAFTVEVIEELKTFLDLGADDLSGLPPVVRDVDDVAFGANLPGVQLAYHSRAARQHVIDAVVEMATGLEQYREAIEEMKLRATEATDATRAAFDSQLAVAESHFPGGGPRSRRGQGGGQG